MTFTMEGKAAFIGALLLVSALSSFPSCKGEITAVNQCGFDLTVFRQDSTPNSRQQFTVPAGQSVGLQIPNPWIGGVIWGSQTGNINNGQATQLEFNINPNGDNRDFYDVSVVNAYNVAAEIAGPSGDPNNLECGSPICSISDINSVCVMDNFFAGPDNACINGDGPGTEPTPSVELWVNVCPTAYTLSNNNTAVVYGCTTGSNYNVVFCP